MGRERRRSVRKRKRLRTKFGVTELEQSGYTGDISLGGLYLIASKLYDTGTRIHLRIMTDDSCFYAEGQVCHAKVVPPSLRRLTQQGMGVRFLTPAEVVNRLIPLARRSSDLVGVECATITDLQRFLLEQLGSGILVAPVEDPVPAVNSVVKFEIRLGFHEQAIQGQGRVIQHLQATTAQEGGGGQVVLEVRESASLCASLMAIVQQAGS